MPKSSRRQWLAEVLGGAIAAQVQVVRAQAGSADELAELSLKEASERIRAKKVSPVELTEACLARIQIYNPKVNAWITVMREQALAQAKVLEKEQASKSFRSPLHGIPIGLKDTIDTAGVRTTAASAVYEYRFPTEDAEVVRRLKAAGAIVLGKCNMHEFDAGATSAVSYWGPVRNPWSLDRVSGGPSGGSAAALAANQCYAALGTDASGGMRGPAAYCGVVGFLPTYGRVSLRGIVPFSWSLDHCGPMTRTVEDAALVMQQIAGYDFKDIDSVDHAVPDFSTGIGAPVGQLRIGLAPQFFDHLDDEVGHAMEEAIALLEKLTRGGHEVSMPSLLHAGVSAEIAAFHENLRGVNGGGYEPATARAFPSSAEAAKAVDYIRGWRELQTVRRAVNEDVFQKQGVDVLVAPTMRRPAPTIEETLVPPSATGGRGGGATPTPPAEGNATPAAARAQTDFDENTRPFNAYGLPVISLCCGFTKSGMPIGLQIAGPRFGEVNVLALAYAYQQATDWHNRKPPLQSDSKVPVLSKAAADQTGG
jgi:aspartyl-tRNA(Asn)/glutamyl-tRNA(Gln) amidotransferase subunit A